MDKQHFSLSLSRLYALFGKGTVPQPVYNELWRRVEDYPDGVLPLVESRLETAERLPSNLYREFRAAWERWKEQNPRQVVATTCPDCGGKAGYWCWSRNDAGSWTHFFSPCPYCQNGGGKTYPAPGELRERGVDVMPIAYKGGPMAYDRDRGFGVLYPAWMTRTGPSAGTTAGTTTGPGTGSPRPPITVGVDMTPDPRRMAALTERERDARLDEPF